MRRYLFVDWATQGYLALVGIMLVAGGGPSVPHWQILAAAHLAGLGLVHALVVLHARWPKNRPLDFLRHFYPVIMYIGFYRETGELNHLIVAQFLDPWFIRLDGRIFGLQPSLRFMAWLPYLPVSEVFYTAYFSYYLMIFGVGLALYFRDKEQFFHYLSVVSFVFYVCFITYICLPVIGPRIFYEDIGGFHFPPGFPVIAAPPYPAAVQAGPAFQVMAWIYRTFEAPGAAFPSSHVAIGITTATFSFRYLRPIRWFHLGALILLCLATVYCRYHYAVDVVAGILTAALLVPLGNRLYARTARS